MQRTQQNKTRVGIIGAGLGGCAVGALLSKNEYDVTIFEKNQKPGGRCQTFFLGNEETGKFRFDIGASMVLMTDIFKTLGEELSRDFSHKGLGLVKCKPSSTIHMHPENGKQNKLGLQTTREQNYQENSFQEVEVSTDFLGRAEEEGFILPNLESFLKEGIAFYNFAKATVLSQNFNSFSEIMTVDNLKASTKLLYEGRKGLYFNLYSYCVSKFKNESVAKALSLQSMYMGLSPYDAFGFYSFLTVDEIVNGIFYPKKLKCGMGYFPKELLRVAKENNAEVKLNSEVVNIVEVQVEQATKVCLSYVNGNEVNNELFDIVVSNADLCYTYKHLVKDQDVFSILDKMKYGCSTISFHWALPIELDSLRGPHHVFLGNSYKSSFEKIFTSRSIPEDISFYLHIPSKIDPDAAPRGCSAVTVLVPVGYEKVPWKVVKSVKQHILQRLELEDIKISNKILYEEVYTPQKWGKKFNLHRNCALGLNHNILQLGPFRPSNQDEKRPWLFFVGANTQPGCGVPTVIHSALNTFQLIEKRKQYTKPISRFNWKHFQKIFRVLEKCGLKSSSGIYPGN